MQNTIESVILIIIKINITKLSIIYCINRYVTLCFETRKIAKGMHQPWLESAHLNKQKLVEKYLTEFGKYHEEHIEEYGAFNDERLTGIHETASITDYSFGVSDRGASIRIPSYTPDHDWKGYVEDRRPASNADPYRIIARILKTSKIAHEVAIK